MANPAKIAILIKTCRGRPSLLWTIHSVQHGLRNADFRFYIADEEPLDPWKKPVYETLVNQGHHIELLDQGTGVGIARNRLIENLEEEDLVLRMDDDFELGGEFRFSALETVVSSSREIGFCADFERQIGEGKSIRSGTIRPAGGNIIISPPKLIKKFHSPFRKYKRVSGVRFSYAEHTRNLLLIKREVFEKVRWNEQLLFNGEHLDFMMSIREAGYKGAYTPDSIHYHRDDLSTFRYKIPDGNMGTMDRPGDEEMAAVYQTRWKCNQITTRYPLSWYAIEAGRRVMASLVN